MVRIVLLDSDLRVGGYLDDRALLTTDIHHAAVFPSDECAIRVLRDTRRITRHTVTGCGWHLQHIAEVA